MDTKQSKSGVLFVGVIEAARRLGVSQALLYQQIQAGKFPHRRIGNRIVVSIKVLEKLAEPPDDKL